MYYENDFKEYQIMLNLQNINRKFSSLVNMISLITKIDNQNVRNEMSKKYAKTD